MSLLDRPGVQRLVSLAEERAGVAIRPAAEVQRLVTQEAEFAAFASEAEELALYSMDYFSGRPSELRIERRRRLAQRARVALLEDPLAGAEAQLLGDFAFGKGISVPTARDPKVQDIIDAAWSDANNAEKLTGYNAQRKLSNELLTASELFVTLYKNGSGRIRVGRLDPDLVIHVVPDPEDRLRPMWYVAEERTYKWDFANDRPAFSQETMEGGRVKRKYWKHWRNVEDAERERQEGLGEEGDALQSPEPGRIANGVVYHVAINQTGEQLRGNPPWARSLRFFTAMNILTEAHVTQAQAASSLIARRAMTGTPKQLAKAASSILSSVGELGAAAQRIGGGLGGPERDTQQFAPPGTPGPMPPGSIWNDNQASRLEAIELKSGSGQMAQTAQIVRAPIAASSGFGQHYLGDASDANLATASTLELPATMHVGAWQEHFEGLYRWFTDRAIEEAVQAGKLGDTYSGDVGKPLSECYLDEAEDRATMERRTKKDLGYEFTMPFPGRRQLTDVSTFVNETATGWDPTGQNVPLRRILLRILFEQVGIDDVSRAVEEAVPEEGLPGAGEGALGGGGGEGGEGGGEPAGSSGAKAGAGAKEPKGEQQQPYGAKSKGTQLEERAIAELLGDTDAMFEEMLANPAYAALMSVGASNGAGG